jgi:hypothetical protein
MVNGVLHRKMHRPDNEKRLWSTYNIIKKFCQGGESNPPNPPFDKREVRGGFTPLESPTINAGDAINRNHQFLVKAGSKPHPSNGG